VQLSARADLTASALDVAVDGRWLSTDAESADPVELPAFDPADLDSARAVVIWMEDGDRFSLTALRPRGAKGQDRDELSVTLPAGSTDQVFDPRLSTEYGPDGRPRRCGIELWVGEDEEGSQRPLRIGAEVPEESGHVTEGPLDIQPLSAHLNAKAGIGVYLLVRG
jgi:hypothetical protein